MNYDDDDEDLDEDSRSLPQSHSPRSSSLAMDNRQGMHHRNNGHAEYDSSIINNDDENNTNNNNTHNDDANDLTPLDNEYMDDDRSDYDEDDDDDDHNDDDEDDLHTTTDYNTTLNTTSQNNTPNRKSRGKKQNKSAQKNNNKHDASNNSTSSRTRSSSSPTQSRSISPSTYNGTNDGNNFPNLAAVAAANGIDSTTAILAAQSLLQQQTPGLSFPSLAATGLLGDMHKEGKEGEDKLDLANSLTLMSDAAAEALLAKAAAFAASEASANGKSYLYLFHVNYEEALECRSQFF